MKKYLPLLLVFLLLLSQTACKKESPTAQAPRPVSQAQENHMQNIEQNLIIETLKVQLTPSRDVKDLDPLRRSLQDLLTAELGMPVEVSLGSDYYGTLDDLKNRLVHVGFLSPVQSVLAHDQGYGDMILTALRYPTDDSGKKNTEAPMSATYRSQLVTHAQSGITSVSDLKGKTIATAGFLSASGFLWPASLLSASGLDPLSDVTWLPVGSHEKAIQAVYNAQADVAFTYKDARLALRENLPDIYEKIRFILDTEDIPGDGLCVSISMDEDLRSRLTQAFLALSQSEEGHRVLRALYGWDGLTEADDSDYDPVRAILKRQEEEGF